MLQVCAERDGQVFGAAVCAERVASEQGEFGEVALVRAAKTILQLDQRAAEHAEEAFGDGPLVGGVVGGRQSAHAAERFKDVAAMVDPLDEGLELGFMVGLAVSKPTVLG